MSKICEHEFEKRDPNNPGYSMTEYDLHAKFGMALRKNHSAGRYEIARTGTGEVVHSGTLEEMVARANDLEGGDNTEIGCDFSCPAWRGRRG